MDKVILGPFKLLGGLAASGLALWGGWKLGTYLGEVALGEKELPWEKLADLLKEKQAEEPLWKRRFSPVSKS